MIIYDPYNLSASHPDRIASRKTKGKYKMDFTYHPTLENAVNHAITNGYTLGEKHFRIIGIDNNKGLYDLTSITGYYLNPRGLIQKTRHNGKICFAVMLH